jgi:hypothetical protein
MITPMVYIQRRIMNDKVPKNKKDHLIPASIIGNFSSEVKPDSRGRNNKVVVKMKEKDGNFKTKAENILYSKGEYDSVIDDLFERRVTDDLWNEYESNLPDLVNTLESRDFLPWEMYINTLIPYAASLFVRDQGYKQWVSSQMNIPSGEDAPDETVQYNRALFYAEYKDELLAYSVDVLLDEKGRFILPDRGISFFDASFDLWRADHIYGYTDGNPNGFRVCLTNESECLTPPSFLIPVSPRAVIKLTPREFLYASPAGDNVPVRYIDATNEVVDITPNPESSVSVKAVDYINKGLAQSARRIMIGADEDILNDIEFNEISDEYFIENILGMTALVRETSIEASQHIHDFYQNVDGNNGISLPPEGACMLRVLGIQKYMKPSLDTLETHKESGLRVLNRQQGFVSDLRL